MPGLLILGTALLIACHNEKSYQHCGSTWYQPQFAGTTTTYVVVNPPR